jgi:hypothetical protein
VSADSARSHRAVGAALLALAGNDRGIDSALADVLRLYVLGRVRGRVEPCDVIAGACTGVTLVLSVQARERADLKLELGGDPTISAELIQP